MQLVVKNKFWSFGGSSIVKDIQDNPVANVKGKVFSVTKKKINLVPLVTKTFPFEKYLDAYKFIDEHREETMKVIINIQE